MAGKTIIMANQFLEAPITDPKHLVNKQYVDDLMERNLKQPVRVATTKNLIGTYNGTSQRFEGSTGVLVVDDVNIAVDDRILVKNQTDATQNGVYIVINIGSSSEAFILERSSDFNASEKISKNLFIRVSEGNTQADILFQLVNDESIILDTSSIVFSPYKSSGEEDTQKNVAEIIGDGVKNSFNITHNLNSNDIYLVARSGNDTILVNWESVSVNAIQVLFDNPLEENKKIKITTIG